MLADKEERIKELQTKVDNLTIAESMLSTRNETLKQEKASIQGRLEKLEKEMENAKKLESAVRSALGSVTGLPRSTEELTEAVGNLAAKKQEETAARTKREERQALREQSRAALEASNAVSERSASRRGTRNNLNSGKDGSSTSNGSSGSSGDSSPTTGGSERTSPTRDTEEKETA